MRRAVVYQFCLRWAQFPAHVCDLLDERGRVDHSKLVPFIVGQEIIALLVGLAIAGQLEQVTVIVGAVLITVLSAAFGYAGFRTWSKRISVSLGAVSSTSTSEHTERRELVTRTWDERGYQEDPEPGR